MKPSRRQFSLGSLMVAIAILAVAFTYPGFSQGLLLGGIVPILLFAGLALIHYLFVKPCFALIDGVHGWLNSRDEASPPVIREPRQVGSGSRPVGEDRP